jgi:NTP pyrophosphatase (non-canonical NTP hydrolase)
MAGCAGEGGNEESLMTHVLTFEAFSRANRKRCEAPDGFNKPVEHWSLSDWFTACMGELGEAANVAKKLNRVRDGIPGNGDISEAELRQMLADEIADTFIYLDLLAQSQGIDLERAVRDKFEATSRKIGYRG